MEYNTFQHLDQTNFEGLHAQECTHMNDIVLCVPEKSYQNFVAILLKK